MPEASIICCFKDASQYFDAMVESVLNQNMDSWELLLIDDGSLDGTNVLALEYANGVDERIRYYSHPGRVNVGKSSSRNLGLTKARGEFACFLDADDIFLPNKLSYHIALLRAQSKATMVVGQTTYWRSWNNTGTDFIPATEVRPQELYAPGDLLPVLYGQLGAAPCICGAMFRRSVALKLGGFDESIQNLYEDQVFFAKFFVDEYVYVDGSAHELYRQHVDSDWHSSIRTGEDITARAVYMSWLYAYIKNRKYVGDDVLKTIKKTRRDIWRRTFREGLHTTVRVLTRNFLRFSRR